MNKKQYACLWIGIIVIILMGLFPPFSTPDLIIKVPCTPEETARAVAAYEAELSARGIDSGIDSDSIDFNENPAMTVIDFRRTKYSSLFIPPIYNPSAVVKDSISRLDYNVHALGVRFSLDLGRLCVQWAIVAVITGGLIYAFRDKPKDKEKEGTEGG